MTIYYVNCGLGAKRFDGQRNLTIQRANSQALDVTIAVDSTKVLNRSDLEAAIRDAAVSVALNLK